MKIGIFMADSNGGYPVPASKGGAVSTLVEHLVKGNNSELLVDMDIISIYDKKAEILSKQYPNIKFIWMTPCFLVRSLDKLVFNFIRVIFKQKKAISYKSVFSLIYCIVKASWIIRRNNYDKVILENNIPLAWSIKLSKYKGEYYYHFHNVPRINAKCKKIFENCTGFLCVSKYVARQIGSKDNAIGPIPENKIKVLYNCIDTTQYYPLKEKHMTDEIKKSLGINEKEKVIVFVGRLAEEKGVDKVLEAVKQINRKDIKILIVGSLMHDTNVMDGYQKKIHCLAESLFGQVIFTGYIPQNEVQKFYQIADVAVLPSMWDEPAGLTMIEAMACGVSVITTMSGGIPEYVGGHAIVLERDDNLVEKIADSINKIFNMLENKCSNTEYVESNFGSEKYLLRFVEYLK